MAWVLDGCTDLLDRPLIGLTSDAAWFATTASAQLARLADAPETGAIPLEKLLCELCSDLAAEFEANARRAPEERFECPSAAAIVVRAEPGTLTFASLGDCVLIARLRKTLHRIGIDEAQAGDARAAETVARFHDVRAHATAADVRAHVMPKLREARARLNTPEGYGVLSIVPPPAHFIKSGRLGVKPGDVILLASDGLTRLIDTFGKYSAETLLDAAISRGIGSLLGEVRALENADPDCRIHPRVKASDDATGLLIRIRS